MPSLDDLGTKQVATGTPADEDYIPFYDVSEFGGDRLKRSTIASLAEAIGSGPVTSADITDRTSDGRTNTGKVLVSRSSGPLTTVGSITLASIYLGENLQIDQFGAITYGSPPVAIYIPYAGGTLGVLRSFENSTAADAVVSVGDAWWDSTLSKARVRLV